MSRWRRHGRDRGRRAGGGGRPVGVGQDDDADDHGHARAAEPAARVQRRRPRRRPRASDVELAGLRAYEIGFVFQGFHLQEAMTAVDNVALGMLYTGSAARAATGGGAGPRSSGSAWAPA